MKNRERQANSSLPFKLICQEIIVHNFDYFMNYIIEGCEYLIYNYYKIIENRIRKR